MSKFTPSTQKAKNLSDIKLMRTIDAVTEIKPNTIKLDYDDFRKKIKVSKVREGYRVFVPNAFCGQNLKFIVNIEMGEKITRTSNGYHVELNTIASDLQVLALQIAMGSDDHREFYNMRRLAQGRLNNWNVLFLEKHELKKGKLVKTSEEKPL